MLVLILGSNNICTELALSLTNKGHDVCVISENSTSLQHLQQFVDCQIVVGCPSHPHILKNANADNADMIIAATSNDEMNMVACQVAYSLFKVKNKIAFISNAHYLVRDELFNNINLPIDTLISLDDIIVSQLNELIDFSCGLTAREIGQGTILAMTTVKKLDFFSDDKFSVKAVFRKGVLVGNNDINLFDDLLFTCKTEDLEQVANLLHGPRSVADKVMLGASSGVVETFIALGCDYNLKVIEPNESICQRLSQLNDNTTVLHGHITEHELLNSENMHKIDVFCAITNDDEDNIMAALQAKELGANKTIAMINKTQYKNMLKNSTIDYTLDPNNEVLNKILNKIQYNWVRSIHEVPTTSYQIVEIILPDKILKTKLSSLNVIAIFYENALFYDDLIPRGSTVYVLIKSSDRVESILNSVF